MAKVAVLMGSDSDWAVMQTAVKTLKSYGVEVHAHVMSAHRTPVGGGTVCAKRIRSGLWRDHRRSGPGRTPGGRAGRQHHIAGDRRAAGIGRTGRYGRTFGNGADAAGRAGSDGGGETARITRRFWPCRCWLPANLRCGKSLKENKRNMHDGVQQRMRRSRRRPRNL